MLTYLFLKNNVPLYQQIYAYIKEDIIQGNLHPNEKLPSKRCFAKNNGISTITVQNAYDQLISEGYIYTLPRKGYYVSKIVPTAENQDKSISLNIQIPKKDNQIRIDISNNTVNPKHFPFSVWTKLIRKTMTEKQKEILEIAPSSGVYDLRQAIANHLHSFRGMLVDPNQIIIGAGTEYLYSVLIQLLGFDNIYATENPGYKKFAQIFQEYNISCQYIDMDNKGILIDQLKRSTANIIHLSPNHHFPTGITMPADRRYEILAWVNEKSNRYVIEDDYDSEFRRTGKPLPTLFSIDHNDKVIYLNTFSKSLTPTIRISYMVLPVKLANRFYQKLSFYACTVSNFEQYTLAAFINEGYFEKHINRMRLFYVRQRKQLIEIIEKSQLADASEILENDSGLHFLLHLKTNKSDKDIVNALLKYHIRMLPVSQYYFKKDKSREHNFIISYSNLNMDTMPAVLASIYKCIQ